MKKWQKITTASLALIAILAGGSIVAINSNNSDQLQPSIEAASVETEQEPQEVPIVEPEQTETRAAQTAPALQQQPEPCSADILAIIQQQERAVGFYEQNVQVGIETLRERSTRTGVPFDEAKAEEYVRRQYPVQENLKASTQKLKADNNC